MSVASEYPFLCLDKIESQRVALLDYSSRLLPALLTV